MVYKFDPKYFNGAIFGLDKTWDMAKGRMEYVPQDLPIPASYFPKSLTFDRASAALPDIFHTARDIIVFSERAGAVMEHWGPGQVELFTSPVTRSRRSPRRKVRERAPGEPLIWRDTPWRDGHKEHRGQSATLIEDVLWRELDANFPDQLHPLLAGED